ncbi:MFS transporter [Streptomyces sp. NPDC048282]|uniref:MFS transporter n=1 Tax=Streptomyces sp. NPDC048282 TaxID=3365528 RepID=UPI0037167CE4
MSATTYRELLRTPSVSWLLTTSVIGRFHQGMTGLALMMLTTRHSSYAVYSVVSAAAVIGAFVGGPLLGRLADVHGRRPVLTVTAVLYALAVGALAVVPPRPVLLVVLALLTGICTPPMTPAVRTTLSALVRPEQRRTFFALEATAQEVIFVAGPVLVSLFATFGGPGLALGACAGLVLAGTLAYVCDRNVEAGRAPEARATGGRVFRAPGLPRLLATGGLLTAALAGQVIGVVAMISGRHASSESGFVLAVGSLGSLVGGLIHGASSRRPARLRHLMLFLAAGLAALTLAPGPVALTVLLFFWGTTVAPAMSVLFDRLSARAPAGSAAEAFGWMGSMFAVGSVLGSALGGVLITAYGARAPVVTACGLAVLAALVCEHGDGSRRRPVAPSGDGESGEAACERVDLPRTEPHDHDRAADRRGKGNRT